MSPVPIRSLLLFAAFALLLAGCDVPPGVTTDALGVGAALALVLRRMATDGTWPQGVTWKEPWKTLIPSLLGALAGMLMAVVHGASWQDALQATLAGLPALLQGAFEMMLPQKKQGEQGTSGTSGGVTGGGARTPIEKKPESNGGASGG